MNTRREANRTRNPASGRAVVILTPTVFAAAARADAAPAAEKRNTVANLVSAAVKLSPSLARLEAGLQMVPRGSVLSSAGQLRPATDLGPWARSAGYGRVSP